MERGNRLNDIGAHVHYLLDCQPMYVLADGVGERYAWRERREKEDSDYQICYHSSSLKLCLQSMTARHSQYLLQVSGMFQTQMDEDKPQQTFEIAGQ